MKNGKFVSALVALTLGTFVGSVYAADEHPAMGNPADENAAGTVSKPAKSTKKKSIKSHDSVKSHDAAASEVQGRQEHPAKPQAGTTVKSHDPAASEVTGRSTHPDASAGSEVKSHAAGQQHDRSGSKN